MNNNISQLVINGREYINIPPDIEILVDEMGMPRDEAESLVKAHVETQAAHKRMKQHKTEGKEYAHSGVHIPFTSRAASAFVQVELAFNKLQGAGIPADSIHTVMEFDELGTKLPVSLEGGELGGISYYKFDEVSLWFLKERNSFFQTV